MQPRNLVRRDLYHFSGISHTTEPQFSQLFLNIKINQFQKIGNFSFEPRKIIGVDNGHDRNGMENANDRRKGGCARRDWVENTGKKKSLNFRSSGSRSVHVSRDGERRGIRDCH